MHEVVRCYDPQASRCSSPLFATNGNVARDLPGFVAEARPFRDWAQHDHRSPTYSAGPVRIAGSGNISNPRSNFKAFQTLAEKFPTQQFIWHGATRNKEWQNLIFLTNDTPWTTIIEGVDLVVWCADDDPCPVPLFEALYMGVRVQLFQKSIDFGLEPLRSEIDGTPILDIQNTAPQHALLHLATKNPKHPEDVERARDYVRLNCGQPPEALLQMIQDTLTAA